MMSLIPSIFLVFFLAAAPLQSAEASCGSCAANMCTSDPSAWASVKKKEKELREKMVPERIIQLVRRTGAFCKSCIDRIGDPRMKVIHSNGNEGVFPWSPPLERKYRKMMKAGQIEAFYIFFNDGKKCSCCNQKAYDDLNDYDSDLDINRIGPIFIYESAGQVGTDQTTGHYARPRKGYPPVLSQQKPKSPRIYHTTCKQCTQKEEAINVINRDIYALKTEIYSLNKNIDVDQRIVIGWFNDIVDLYNDASLDEATFQSKKKYAEDRMQIFQDSADELIKILNKRKASLIAKEADQPKRDKEFTDCGKQKVCTDHKPIFEDPAPAESISCNTITDSEIINEDFSAHVTDLSRLEVYLGTSANKWNSCENDYTCADMDCSKTESTLADHKYLLENIRLQKDWEKKYKEKVDEYYLNLSKMTIQSQTNLSDTQWIQAIQSYMTNVVSAYVNIIDLSRVIRSLLKKPDADAAQDAVTRATTVDKLLKADQAFETVVTSASLLNTMTSHVQFPYVKGTGVPGIRILNNYMLSLSLCGKSILSELVDSLDHVRGNTPNWRDNVLMVVAKMGLCVSTYQMMQRQKIIDQIKKDIIAEEKVRKAAYARKLCQGRRYDRVIDFIPKLEQALPNVTKCIDGPCSTPKIPNTRNDFQTYGSALKHFQSIMVTVKDRLFTNLNNIVFHEAPAATISLPFNEFQPGERIAVNYSVPWCKAGSSFMAILEASEPSGKRSTSDIDYEHQQLRGQAKGKISILSPSDEGDYHLRIYDHTRDGSELKRIPFKVTETLGNLIDQGDFTEVYLGALQDETNAHLKVDNNLQPGFGIINLAARDAAGKRKSSHFRVYHAGTNTAVYAGWNPVITLPVGLYDIKLEGYHPARWMKSVQNFNQQISYYNYGGDGRLLLFPKDAMGKAKGSHITITSPDSNFKLGTWSHAIDLPPGRYTVSFDNYVPTVVQEFVEIETAKRTSIKVSGYGRVKFEQTDALGKKFNSHITVRDHRSQNRIWAGWYAAMDFPPGSYDISFDNYTPPIVIKNFQVTEAIERTAVAGGYGRLNLIIKDGLGKKKGSHVSVYPKGSQNRVIGGWSHTLDLPDGKYTVYIDGFHPQIKAGDLEVRKGQVSNYVFDGYGRLSILSASGNPHRTVYYAGTETRVVAGWSSEFDVKPGLYDVKVEINGQEVWSKGVRVSSQNQTVLNFP
jgi:hypothetical protein